MRGRRSLRVEIASEDVPALERMARRQTAAWFQVRRARTLLAAHRGEPVQDIADALNCHRNTVRRTCQQYEQLGLAGLFRPIQRSGRPREISPPPARPDR
jgi:transposase